MEDLSKVARDVFGLTKEEILEHIDVMRDRYADENIIEYKRFDYLMEAMLLSQRLMEFVKAELEYERRMEDEEAFERFFSVWNKIPLPKKNPFPDDRDRPAPNRYHTDGDGGCYDDFGTGLGGQPEN